MLSPEEFREEYPTDELESELPDRPIASLRDIQYLYGRLYALGTAGGGKYADYLTPDAADDLLDEDDSLIVVRIDLSGDEPQLANDERGSVWVTRYTDNLVEKVAHCYYYNRGAGIDHSLSHKSGQNKSPEKLGEYAKHRFTRWPTEDGVQEVAKTHEEGWIIDQLATLGEDSGILNRILNRVERKVGSQTTAIITCQIKTKNNGSYCWPGEIDVLNESLKSQKISKLVSKNKANNSCGQATGLITDGNTRTVGTAQDPLNHFLAKQVEKFPGLDPDEAWRSHPISEDAAVTLMNAESVVDECTYSTFGATVYYLPFFRGQITSEKGYELYKILYSVTEEKESLTPVEGTYSYLRGMARLEEEGARLRFYVSAVMKHQASRYDVFGETLNGKIEYPVNLAQAHESVIQSTAFRNPPNGWTAPLPTHPDWALLSDTVDVSTVSTGYYFAETFPAGDDDTDAAADDPRIRTLVSVLGGEPIPVSLLLEAYVDRLLESNQDSFPRLKVAQQFAQLSALAAQDVDLLTADGTQKPITQPSNYDTQQMTDHDTRTAATDGGTVSPKAKLDAFIDGTPAFDHAPRRGAFLLGTLVGEVGSYQSYRENRSTTLVDQYPVKSITQARLKKVAQEAIGKTLTYTRQEGRSITKFEHVVNPLRETILNPDPNAEEWDIGTDDLRFYYALGVTYGMNDRPQSTGEQTGDEQTVDAQTDD